MMTGSQRGKTGVARRAATVREELRRYDAPGFDFDDWTPVPLPLPDEPFVATWEEWEREARHRGVWAVLRERLPQLRFPIRRGMSETADYRAATRRGVAPETLEGATGLELSQPDRLELTLHPTAAGRVPVIVARCRDDFVTLVRALARRNEPSEVSASQGALMVSGYNDWVRVAALRRAWAARDPGERTATWAEEMARIKPRRELYQDRFVLLSDGPYSGVPAVELGLEEAAWRERSLIVRREHECAHYATKRLLGMLRNHVVDEIVADYTGLVAAFGRFRAAWFLRFLGLDGPAYRPGSRLEIYRGDPPLADGAFGLLQEQVVRAAETLERFDAAHPAGRGDGRERAVRIVALASLRLEELSSPGGGELLRRRVEELRQAVPWSSDGDASGPGGGA